MMFLLLRGLLDGLSLLIILRLLQVYTSLFPHIPFPPPPCLFRSFFASLSVFLRACADLVLLETTYLNTLTLSLLGASIRALIGWTILDWTMLGGASARHALWVGGKLLHVDGGFLTWLGV